MNQKINRRHGLQTLAALSAWPVVGHAQTSPAARKPLPIEAFLMPGQMGNLRLSPDGQFLLALRNIQGRSNLVVMDLQTKATKVLTSYRRASVTSALWVNNERIAYGLGNSVGDTGFAKPGLFSVNKDGSEPRAPAELKDDEIRVNFKVAQLEARGAQSDQNIVIITKPESEGRHRALYRHNLLTGKEQRIISRAPGLVQDWGLDSQDRPRAAVTRTPELAYTLWVRPEPEGDWVALHHWTVQDPGASIEAIDADDQLYVLYQPPGGDEQALGRIDLRKPEWPREPLLAIKGSDILPGAVRLDAQKQLQSVVYEADRARVMHADAKLDAIQTALEQQFPDSIVSLSPDEVGRRILVTVRSDVDAGRFFLFERESGALSQIGAARPWLKPEQLAKTRFFRYAARDGLSIPAQLTLPPGAKPGEKHPLLVLHYGGPHVRAIHWGFDPMVQFLASRGYAVFMPAPRMSTGWGWRHHKAGWKQWGLAMQDDVTDGVLQLVKEGVADRDRLAIMGASYGGYLTMMGLAKNPELWRCGINWVGVTDIEHKFFSWVDYAGSDFAEHQMPHMVGDPVKDLEQLRRTSPVRRVAEIQAPVMLAYGGADRRVPLVNGLAMRDALAAAGKPHEWVLYPEEGHGFRAPPNMKDFWLRIEKFLAEHMAPRTPG